MVMGRRALTALVCQAESGLCAALRQRRVDTRGRLCEIHKTGLLSHRNLLYLTVK